MKKIGTYLILLFLLLIPFNVSAVETTDKLYMDIQIEENGSIFIREVAVLSGSYNGRLRNIEYRNSRLGAFNGSISSFGGSDIYNGSSITDLKIYDISNKYLIDFDSINDLNREYTEVSSASKGNYGVYTRTTKTDGIDLQIFNPSSSGTAFYMEYRVNDAVVVHEDIAELYWNLLGTTYEENVTDFEARVHLPNPDSDLRVWGHGPLYGETKKTSDEEAIVTITNLEAYKAVSVRLMFDKALVPFATKLSNVAGRDLILEYEQQQADLANQEREKLYQDLLDDVEYFLKFAEENRSLYYYNRAYNLFVQLKDSDEKTELEIRMQEVRSIIEVKLVQDVELQIKQVEEKKTKKELANLEEKISLLLEGDTKNNFVLRYQELEEMVLKHYQTMQMISYALFLGLIGVIGLCIYRLNKKYNKDIVIDFDQQYYRDFPRDYGPGVLEYLVKHSISTKTFSAMILDLIRRKVISVEEVPGASSKKKIYKFVRQETNEVLSSEDILLMNLLFVTVGGNTGKVSLDQIKNYGSTESKARRFIKEYKEITKEVQSVAEKEDFFANVVDSKSVIIVGTVIMSILLFSYSIRFESVIIICLTPLVALIVIVYIACNKYRTKKGKTEYEMWMAHKRFLLDFGRFQEKELPEVALWERYLVTATVLGVAKQVQESMKIHIESMENMADVDRSLYSDLATINMMNHLINADIPNAVASTVSRAMSHSQSTIASANSSSSSGDGFGGGFSGGGGFGGGGGGGGRF